MLARSPGASAIAILTLALGIGANTAIFSVLSAVLLRPLPFHDPDRVVVAWEPYEAVGSRFFAGRMPARLKTWLLWKQRNRTFEGLTATQVTHVNLTGAGKPERIEAARIPADFFEVLGVRAAVGRDLSREDQRGRAVLVSHGFWTSHLGGTPGALGRSVRIDGAEHGIVGVLPASFHLPALMEGLDQQRPELWIAVDPEVLYSDPNAAVSAWTVLARLKPGVSLDQARADLRTMTARLRQEDPDFHTGWTASLYPVHVEDVGPRTRRTLFLLQAAVSLLLLIACANVANLLLARVVAREREMAVRLALGAGGFRIARQLFVETLLLAAVGAAAGAGLAPAILKGLAAIAPLAPGGINRPETWRVDAGVLAFTCALATLSAVVAACAPSLVAARRHPGDALRTRGSAGEGSRLARRVLIAAEVALACMVLVGAGLLVRSLRAVMSIDPGFRTDRVLTTNIDLPRYRYPAKAQQTAFCERLLERVKSLPGVESAALAHGVPFQSLSMQSFRVEGQQEPARGKEPMADFRRVSPDYFRTMGIPLLKGRGFAREDAADKAAPVIIVNETFARKAWPGQDPIGKALIEDKQRVPVIGVVADTRQLRLEEPPRPEIFHPRTSYDSMVLVVRTAADPKQFGNAMAKEVWAIDPDQPIRDARSMSYLASWSLSQRQFNTILLAAFAGLALVLAWVGIYGVISHSVARRTQEIGVRMALGAGRRDVLALVMRESLGVALIGLLAGAAGAAATVQLLSALLYGVAPWDPAAFAAAPILLLFVVVAATLLPAFRAARIQPTAALCYE
ncbi:MAG: ABC transporter permease [Acidobacteria bacterium]|nr:ABC transporter permease [Acidobacteriota bacterium]